MATDEEYDYDEFTQESGIISNIKNNLDLVTLSDWMMVLVVAFSILILSGIIYVITEVPDFIEVVRYRGTQFIYNIPPIDSSTGQFATGQFNSSALNDMYIFEMIIVAATISLGVIGLLLIRNATRFIDQPEKAVQVLAIGVTCFLVALLLLYFFYNFKGTGQFPNISGVVQ